MDYPFEFEWEFKKDVLNITMKNEDWSQKLELYGMNSKEFNIDKDTIKGYLDMMLTTGIEQAALNPMPEIKVLGGECDHEAVEFMQKYMAICDKASAKVLALRMWGVKK